MIWNEGIECASREKIEAIQLERLRSTVENCYNNVPHYKKKLDAAGVKPGDFKTLADITKIPFTEKDDLRANYPYKLFAVPMKDVVRIHASSGTTGKPTVVGYTQNDLDMWAEVVARLACAAGATSEDIAQISFGYTLFTGAFGLHYGLEKLGATIIPISGGNTDRQINVMEDFGTTLLVSTPSYALYLAEVAKKKGIDTKKLPLKIGMFGGEGHTEQMRAQIEKELDIIATENYGLSEIIGPGTSGECTVKDGMHIAEDHFYCEIVDKDTLEPVPYGEPGEMVITSLSKEALPILRYRTKDITWLIPEKCKCGRTSMRMAKIQGRTDDMLIIRGVNVFPSQIEGVLLDVEGIGPHYEIIVKKDGVMDKIEVMVELVDASLLESFSALEEIEKKIKHDLFTILNISADVHLAEPESLKRFEGKAQRVTDLR
ncbi:MAG: phenylacetate--CoA ligase [Clostridia bacterium]|jgi:phenylacetate-CoA ligase|nr:phenylacetate--CoA ligase [Clostridia bacterium]MBT7121961.1 phenylacetate--CoA ligase [Clostridia bacterium]